MKRLLGYAILAFYALGFRQWANRLQRRLTGEHKAPRGKLPDFRTPEEIEAFARPRFQWRKDSARLGGVLIPLDWYSDPMVFQYRLATKKADHGDCDDYHAWFAECLRELPGSVGVDRVYLLSSGYEMEGHTTCVFRCNGKWFHVNYGISRIDDPNDAPVKVASWGADTREVPWAVFEDGDGKAVAVWYTKRDKVEV